jgi:Ca2+-binding RTX toxin-like protein
MMRRAVLVGLVVAGVVPLAPAVAGAGNGPATCLGREVTITAVAGEPTVGTSGNDVILGTNGDDEIDGAGGNDRICSLGGDDTVLGGAGRDRLNGGRGDDDLDGGAGRDRCSLGPGDGTLVSCERPAVVVDITIAGFAFDGDTVPAGSRLVIRNTDSAPHTLTSADAGVDTGTLIEGQAFVTRAPAAGTYDYICTIHPFMTGSLTTT